MSVVTYTVPAHTRTYKSGKTVFVAEFVATRIVQSLRRATEKLIVREKHIRIGAEKLKKYQAKKQAKKAFIASLPPIEYNYSLMNGEKAVFTFECTPEPIDLKIREADFNSSEASKTPKPKTTKPKTTKPKTPKTKEGIYVTFDDYNFDAEFIQKKFSSDFTEKEMKDICRNYGEDGDFVHSFVPADSYNGWTYNQGFIFRGKSGRHYTAEVFGINTSSSFAGALQYRQYERYDDEDCDPSTFYSQADFKRKFGIKIPDCCDLQTVRS